MVSVPSCVVLYVRAMGVSTNYANPFLSDSTSGSTMVMVKLYSTTNPPPRIIAGSSILWCS
jgi:hypothetical protein